MTWKNQGLSTVEHISDECRGPFGVWSFVADEWLTDKDFSFNGRQYRWLDLPEDWQLLKVDGEELEQVFEQDKFWDMVHELETVSELQDIESGETWRFYQDGAVFLVCYDRIPEIEDLIEERIEKVRQEFDGKCKEFAEREGFNPWGYLVADIYCGPNTTLDDGETIPDFMKLSEIVKEFWEESESEFWEDLPEYCSSMNGDFPFADTSDCLRDFKVSERVFEHGSRQREAASTIGIC